MRANAVSSLLQRKPNLHQFSKFRRWNERANFCSQTTTLNADHSLVDSRFAPSNFDNSAVVYSNAVSKDEEQALLKDIKTKMKRRRYERGHWDAVIVQYKEIELLEDDGSFSHTTKDILSRVRLLLSKAHFPKPPVWLPCHAIELGAQGELKAHVDSVRFSGDLVAGLSLQSSSIMRLKPAPPEEVDSSIGDSTDNAGPNEQLLRSKEGTSGHVDMLLPPRSLYVLTGSSRYLYTHELLEDKAVFSLSQTLVPREDRFSVIFRDARASNL